MGARFIGLDREQVFLMPPSVRDWVPEGHLVWTVLEAVGELDLSAFYAEYRADGHGRPAYEPSMMVALLLYAYARGNRSARGHRARLRRGRRLSAWWPAIWCRITRRSRSSVAVTSARWARSSRGVLGLCARAGLASVGVVAIDGTKMSANASINANRDFGQIAREILAEAAEIDRREDELYGTERGDELPEHLRTREGRRKALREAKERLERERDQRDRAGRRRGCRRGGGRARSARVRDAPAGPAGVGARGPPRAGAQREREARPIAQGADRSAV